MNINNKEQILIAFKDKILAIRNYRSEKKEFLVRDFVDQKILEEVLEEIETGESDITPAGKSFLGVYYGFDTLATIFEKPQMWFLELKPMEVITFIEESKGNKVSEQNLRVDLLPPENI